MRAGLGLYPGWFGRHGHILISDLENSLNLWLPHKEDDTMFIDGVLVNDARHVFDFLHDHLIQDRLENLIVKAHWRNLLQYVSGWIVKVDTVIFVIFLQDYFKLSELLLDIDAVLTKVLQISDLYLLYLAELCPNVDILRNILDHSMLWVHDDIIAGDQ